MPHHVTVRAQNQKKPTKKQPQNAFSPSAVQVCFVFPSRENIYSWALTRFEDVCKAGLVEASSDLLPSPSLLRLCVHERPSMD